MPDDPNPLHAYFRGNTGPLIHKWMHYFDIYDRHLSAYRGKAVTLVEFGVFHGGSLQMWRDYLGPDARLVGVDIDPRCRDLGSTNTEIIIGDQQDRTFLRTLRQRIGSVDIVIDDGGHTMRQQIATFEELWPTVKEGGLYICEDLHTSYWPHYGGGVRRQNTFIEYSKRLIDQLHAWHHSGPKGSLTVDDYTRTLGGMHVYDSVIVFDKAVVERPFHRLTGIPSFDDESTRTLLRTQAAYEGSDGGPEGVPGGPIGWARRLRRGGR